MISLPPTFPRPPSSSFLLLLLSLSSFIPPPPPSFLLYVLLLPLLLFLLLLLLLLLRSLLPFRLLLLLLLLLLHHHHHHVSPALSLSSDNPLALLVFAPLAFRSFFCTAGLHCRNRHQPKPFKDLVIRRLAATGNEPFKDPDLSKCMLTFHLPPLRRDLLRPPASSNLGACILAFTPSRTHTCSHARSRVSATTADQCDDAKCTSSGNDCCAPLEIGEAATCKDSYIPVRAGQACGDYDEGLYRCCKS